MDSMHDAKVDSVLFLECSESELVERMYKRAALLGRTDDNPDTLGIIHNILETYMQKLLIFNFQIYTFNIYFLSY
jgi:adenylate kinase family enzyme